jgi:hypothetical protein
MAQPSAPSRDPEQAALIDRRVIAFRPLALVAAMQSAGPQLGLLSEEEVTEARPLPGRQAVAFDLRHDGTISERVLGAAELGSVLIAYCIGAGVPMPSRAGKTLEVTRGGVTLDFVTTYGTPPRRTRGAWRS